MKDVEKEDGQNISNSTDECKSQKEEECSVLGDAVNGDEVDIDSQKQQEDDLQRDRMEICDNAVVDQMKGMILKMKQRLGDI